MLLCRISRKDVYRLIVSTATCSLLLRWQSPLSTPTHSAPRFTYIFVTSDYEGTRACAVEAEARSPWGLSEGLESFITFVLRACRDFGLTANSLHISTALVCAAPSCSASPGGTKLMSRQDDEYLGWPKVPPTTRNKHLVLPTARYMS